MRFLILLGIVVSTLDAALSRTIDSQDLTAYNITENAEVKEQPIETRGDDNDVDMSKATSSGYNANCDPQAGGSIKKCDAGVMYFGESNYKGKVFHYLLKDPEDVLVEKSKAKCHKVTPNYIKSFKLHKLTESDETWGCKVTKSTDCTGEFRWTFASQPTIGKNWSGQINSIKCWKAGT